MLFALQGAQGTILFSLPGRNAASAFCMARRYDGTRGCTQQSKGHCPPPDNRRNACHPAALLPVFLTHLPVLLRFCRPSPPTPQWRYAFAQRSDAGMVRPNNEDAVHVEEAPAWSVAVLADGMGGYRAGEVASALAVKCITHSLQASALKSATKNQPARMKVVHRALEHCVQAANTAVRTHAREHADCKGMGATVVAAVFTQDRLVLAHLGDSRAYLWRGAALTQLTSDHSWLQEQIDAGQISPDAAAQSGLGHLVTRALGVSDRARPTLREQALEAGDRILLCSDGLSDLLAPGDIAALLATAEPLERQAEQLIACANALGGHDNISVILASVDAASAD